MSEHRMKTATLCPVDPEAGHLMVDRGRSEQHRAHLLVCRCGVTRLGLTDEMEERMAKAIAPLLWEGDQA